MIRLRQIKLKIVFFILCLPNIKSFRRRAINAKSSPLTSNQPASLEFLDSFGKGENLAYSILNHYTIGKHRLSTKIKSFCGLRSGGHSSSSTCRLTSREIIVYGCSKLNYRFIHLVNCSVDYFELLLDIFRRRAILESRAMALN